MHLIVNIGHNYVTGLNLVYEILNILNISSIEIVVSHLYHSIVIMTQMVDIQISATFDMQMTVIKVGEYSI